MRQGRVVLATVKWQVLFLRKAQLSTMGSSGCLGAGKAVWRTSGCAMLAEIPTGWNSNVSAGTWNTSPL
jgi:hypothetical protein